MKRPAGSSQTQVSKDWLLIKHTDAWSKPGPSGFGEESILSGLTLEDLAAGRSPGEPIRAALARLRAPRRALSVQEIGLMLAETRAQPFSAEAGCSS